MKIQEICRNFRKPMKLFTRSKNFMDLSNIYMKQAQSRKPTCRILQKVIYKHMSHVDYLCLWSSWGWFGGLGEILSCKIHTRLGFCLLGSSTFILPIYISGWDSVPWWTSWLRSIVYRYAWRRMTTEYLLNTHMFLLFYRNERT